MKKVTNENPLDVVDADEVSEEDFFKWVMSQREFAIHCVLRWCSELTREDAEDIFSWLCERLANRGRAILGAATIPNLIHHLRREKENYRRWKFALKRGGKVIHESLDDFLVIRDLPGSVNPISYANEFLATVDGYLRLVSIEATGRLAILAVAMRRALQSYKSPVDLYNAMTDEEKIRFLPCDHSTLEDGGREKVIKQIGRTLVELRKRLRELRKGILEN